MLNVFLCVSFYPVHDQTLAALCDHWLSEMLWWLCLVETFLRTVKYGAFVQSTSLLWEIQWPNNSFVYKNTKQIFEHSLLLLWSAPVPSFPILLISSCLIHLYNGPIHFLPASPMSKTLDTPAEYVLLYTKAFLAGGNVSTYLKWFRTSHCHNQHKATALIIWSLRLFPSHADCNKHSTHTFLHVLNSFLLA